MREDCRANVPTVSRGKWGRHSRLPFESNRRTKTYAAWLIPSQTLRIGVLRRRSWRPGTRLVAPLVAQRIECRGGGQREQNEHHADDERRGILLPPRRLGGSCRRFRRLARRCLDGEIQRR